MLIVIITIVEIGAVMIKGTEKRVVRVKDIGGDIFEEAYFVLKEGRLDVPHPDMISEAVRIIEENSNNERDRSERERKAFRPLLLTLIVSAAIFVAAVIGLVIFS